jgi:hypothetical protein
MSPACRTSADATLRPNSRVNLECKGSGDRRTTDAIQQSPKTIHSGSIYEWGVRFQPFRISDWEMVAAHFHQFEPIDELDAPH